MTTVEEATPIWGVCVRLAEKNKCLARSNKSARGVAGKGPELAAPNYRPADAGELPDLDAALAAFAGAIEEEG